MLSESINPFNDLLRYGSQPDAWTTADSRGLAALDLEIVRQATMIAYNNSFLLISMILGSLIPFILLFRHKAKPVPPPPGQEAPGD